MSACCRTCKCRFDGVKSDHTLLGSGIDIDSDMDGFICLALAYEGEELEEYRKENEDVR